MLDRKFILDNLTAVKANCQNRGLPGQLLAELDQLVEIESQRRAQLQVLEQLNRSANEISPKIGKAKDAAEREALERRMAAMNESADRLLDPVRAAGALLAALGAPSTELPLPPMELAELLERREWIEERHGGHDAARAEV
ncbi:MAG: hypothetical protein ACK53V_22425, partial [Planctomycetota bacterium]